MPLLLSAGLALGIAALPQGVPVARLTPVTGKAYRLVLVEERRDDRGVQRFTSERRLVFHRLANGFALDLTITESTTPPGGPGTMLGAAMAGLKGRSFRFLLDAEGRVTSIDDEDAVWNALCDAVDRAANATVAGSPARDRAARSMATVFRSLPADGRRAMLTSMAAPAIAGTSNNRQPQRDTAITLPARSSTGTTAMLPGRETVELIDGRTMTITTAAEGDVAAPDAAGPATAHIRVSITRRIDRVTGLVLESREERETTIGSGAELRRSISVSTTRLIDPVS